ncbi:multi-sensor hybrid histidine kinase [Stanieria sp. NIES-3757]|nr:multi-sensor hybrid histidine kinase [Stanieria sp. NIES-3757]
MNSFSLDQVLNPHPLIVNPTTPLIETIGQMNRSCVADCTLDNNDFEFACSPYFPVSCALIMADSQLVGIFTKSDLLRLIAEGKTLAEMTIGEAMTKPVTAFSETEVQDLSAILNLINQHKIHHLPILDKQNHLLGIITQKNLLQALKPKELETEQQEAQKIDITDSKQTELEIDKFFFLAENSSEFIGMCDLNFVPFYANEAARQLVGLDDLQQYSDLSVKDFFFPEDRDFIINEFFPRVLREGKAEVEIRFRHFKTGEALWMIYNVHCIREENERPIALATLSRNISDRKQLELSLQASETKLSQILDNAIAAIASFRVFNNQTWEYDYFSAGCERLFGYTREEFMADKMLWLSRVFPEDRETLLISVFDQIFAEHTFTIEFRFYHKNGSLRWISSSHTSQQIEANCWQVTVVNQDITDRKQLELSLQTSEAKLSRILDTAIAAISSFYVYDNQDWDYEYWSAGCEKLYGYSLAELADKHFWLSQVDPEDREQILMPLFEDFFAEQDATAEYRFRRKDGLMRWFSSSYTSRKIADNCWIVTTVNHDITERKQAEIALQESQHRIQQQLAEIETIYQSAPIGLNVLDADLRFVRINQRLAEMNGLPVEYHLGRTVREVLPLLADTAEPVLQTILATGEPLLNVEISGETPAQPGVQRTWLESFLPLKDGDRIIGISTVCEEITERKQTELMLQQQIAREHLLAEITQAIHQSLDVEEILKTAVDRVRQFLQTDRVVIFRFYPDWSGTVVSESVTPEFTATLELEIMDPCFGADYVEPYSQGRVSAIADFSSSDVELCYKDLMAQFQVRANLVVPILQRENLWGLLIAHHCSDPREWLPEEVELLQQLATQLGIAIQQAELYQKNAEQAALIDIASDGIFVRDLSNRILFWNQGAERLYGWTAEEVSNRVVQELFARESSAKLETALDTTINRGHWYGELQQLTKTGQEIIVASRWTLINNRPGNSSLILVVNTDITEKKLLEKQLLHAQRLESIGTLAGGIAHDLNNILTPILSLSQLLQLKIPNLDQSTLNLLSIIRNNALRGAEIVKQVLLFSGEMETEWKLINLAQIIEEILKLIRETFPKSIVIEEYILSNLWQVEGDSTQLHQLIMNLCVNARDAMPDGGKLIISAENLSLDEQYSGTSSALEVGNYILITITDTGMGIEPELINRIFEPFFTTKQPGQGTGLGLSTAIGIVKNHGGEIKVESNPRSGTQFQIYLPASEAIAGTQTMINDTIPFGKKELILIVDDEAPIREITKATLETHNYRVVTANDGIEAIAVYAQQWQEIEVVLMDLIMPEMDGLTAMLALKKINPRVKLIATSGLATKDQVTAAESIGIKAVLVKPYTAEKLLLILSKVTKNQ